MDAVLTAGITQSPSFANIERFFVEVLASRLPSLDLSHLSKMMARKQAVGEKVDYSKTLMQLRVLSRKRRTEEYRARCHWFTQVVPTYEAEICHRFMPVAAFADEVKLIGQRTTRKEGRLAEMNDRYTLKLLLGSTANAMAV